MHPANAARTEAAPGPLKGKKAHHLFPIFSEMAPRTEAEEGNRAHQLFPVKQHLGDTQQKPRGPRVEEPYGGPRGGGGFS